MKIPIKPEKPSKPIPPNPKQKFNQYSIDASHLFIINEYWNYEGNHITETEYDRLIDCGEHCDKDTKHCMPSIATLINLAPKDIPMDNIFIDLKLSYDSGDNYDCHTFQDINVVYETPFDYNKELELYNMALKSFELNIDLYNKNMLQYKKDLESYKDFKEKSKIEKKKLDLEKQLKYLNEK